MSEVINNNDYLITPFTFDDEKIENKKFYTLEELLINSCKEYLRDNNNGSKKRRLQILSCFSDHDIEYYKTFFTTLFDTLKSELNFKTPFTDVRILFNKLDFERTEFQKLKKFFKSSKFNGCEFDIRTSSEGSLLHAKTIALSFGDNRLDGVLFCTSANFTKNAFSGKNLEFIHRTENKNSINTFLYTFDEIWLKAMAHPKFTMDLEEVEATSIYLLKGYFLIDNKSEKLPFNNPEEIKFKEGGDSPALKPYLETLLLSESSQSKNINFLLILLESFFGKEHREAIAKVSSRHNFNVLCSQYLDTYWAMPDTFNTLNEKKNNPFQPELDFYIKTIRALGLKLENENEAIAKLNHIISAELFDLFDIDMEREIFIKEIILNSKHKLNSVTDITVWELFGLNAIKSNLANYRGEVDDETLKSIANGYQKEFIEKFNSLFSAHGNISTLASGEFNKMLFKELAKKRKESRDKLAKIANQLK
jgi:hypothetical protein